MAKILISGGAGLIGSNLTKNLEMRGHEVILLSRNPKKNKQTSFYWNPAKGEIDLDCLKGTDCIINLAGTGVADKRWTSAYKAEILDSRVSATQLLIKTLQNNPNQVSTFIGASAVGIYGNNPVAGATEESEIGDTFLADVCAQWEQETLKAKQLGIRTLIVRIGIVLSKEGGFIKEMSMPAKFGFGAALGSGKMITPWIHINDLSRIFIHLLEQHKLTGIYNGVSPHPETNKELVRIICKALKRPYWMPSVPEFMLKILVGEMAPMLLADQKISAKKIISTGFKFQFPNAHDAIMELLKKK
ncbi:MAG: TIGR01777 family protein [Bacteroidetes bacterium B1(2017)]|nr:MAG: TIGR01777 family protein [Bacteroidetes bacterium B1(2017)]